MGSGTSLGSLIAENRDAIAAKLHEHLVTAYPAESSAFLKKQKDQFANPLGYALREMVQNMLDCLCSGADDEALYRAVYPVIQIKAVQSFKPSESISFVFSFRDIIRGQLSGASDDVMAELQEVMDRIARISFDVYVSFRDKVHEIKEGELKQNLYMLLRKANLVADGDAL